MSCSSVAVVVDHEHGRCRVAVFLFQWGKRFGRHPHGCATCIRSRVRGGWPQVQPQDLVTKTFLVVGTGFLCLFHAFGHGRMVRPHGYQSGLHAC